jgi:hypothetical protein
MNKHANTKSQVDNIGTLLPIVEMFAHAQNKLKWPAVRFKTLNGEHTVRIAPAGIQSRNSGCLYVTSNELSWDRRTYYGKITQQGKLQPAANPATWHPKLWEQFKVELTSTLEQFAISPREYATMTGKKYGYCCFCARELTAPDSLAAGYGPRCAENYGLPHAGMAKVVEREKDYQDALKDVDDFAADSSTPHIDIGGHNMPIRKTSATATMADAYARETTVEALTLYLGRMVAEAYAYKNGKPFNARYHAEKILELVENEINA